MKFKKRVLRENRMFELEKGERDNEWFLILCDLDHKLRLEILDFENFLQIKFMDRTDHISLSSYVFSLKKKHIARNENCLLTTILEEIVGGVAMERGGSVIIQFVPSYEHAIGILRARKNTKRVPLSITEKVVYASALMLIIRFIF